MIFDLVQSLTPCNVDLLWEFVQASFSPCRKPTRSCYSVWKVDEFWIWGPHLGAIPLLFGMESWRVLNSGPSLGRNSFVIWYGKLMSFEFGAFTWEQLICYLVWNVDEFWIWGLHLGHPLSQPFHTNKSIRPLWLQFLIHLMYKDLSDHLQERLSNLSSTLVERVDEY